jgi:hypothetical protein
MDESLDAAHLERAERPADEQPDAAGRRSAPARLSQQLVADLATARVVGLGAADLAPAEQRVRAGVDDRQDERTVRALGAQRHDAVVERGVGIW